MALELNGTTGVSAVQTGAVESGDLPAGSVIQVVNTTKTDTFSTSSTSYVVPTGLTLDITPLSASSSILLFFAVPVSYDVNNNEGVGIAPFRDGSNLINPDSPGDRTPTLLHWNSNNDRNSGVAMILGAGQFLDIPNTTSTLTYDVRVIVLDNQSTVFVNRSTGDLDTARRPRGVATLTLMEIAG